MKKQTFFSLSVPNMHYPVNSVSNSSPQPFFDLKPITGPRAPHPVLPSSSFSNININSPFTCSASNTSLISLSASSYSVGNSERARKENNVVQRPSLSSTHQQLRADKLSTTSLSGQVKFRNIINERQKGITYITHILRNIKSERETCF